jgi:hypothetical protein
VDGAPGIGWANESWPAERAINIDQLKRLYEKVHPETKHGGAFDAKDIVTIPDEGSNATDDDMISVLEDHSDDPVAAELTGFINALTEDEQIDLVAMAWLGRGDSSIDDWDELRVEAARGTTSGPRPICWACRCCLIIWRKRSRSSAARARNSRWGVCNLLPQH